MTLAIAAGMYSKKLVARLVGNLISSLAFFNPFYIIIEITSTYIIIIMVIQSCAMSCFLPSPTSHHLILIIMLFCIIIISACSV